MVAAEQTNKEMVDWLNVEYLHQKSYVQLLLVGRFIDNDFCNREMHAKLSPQQDVRISGQNSSMHKVSGWFRKMNKLRHLRREYRRE